MKLVTIDVAVLYTLADVARVALHDLLSGLDDGSYEDDDIAGYSSDEIAAACLAVTEVPFPRPQVVVDLTGGVGSVVAANAEVEVNFLDYEIQDDEQDDYVVDPDGDQAWLYGEVSDVNPDKLKEILSWPTVEDIRGEGAPEPA